MKKFFMETFQNEIKSLRSTPVENVVNFLLFQTNFNNLMVYSSTSGSDMNVPFMMSEVFSISTRHPNLVEMCFDINRVSRQTKSI